MVKWAKKYMMSGGVCAATASIVGVCPLTRALVDQRLNKATEKYNRAQNRKIELSQ